jgi:hypothetical protein
MTIPALHLAGNGFYIFAVSIPLNLRCIMKRFLVPAMALALAATAHADENSRELPEAPLAKVEKLSCRAANGVTLETVENTPFVESKWFGFRATYQLLDQPIINGGNYVRIPLGMKDKPATNLYDVFLWGKPEAGRLTTLDGVIGQTYYGAVFPPYVESPETLPVAFRAIAAIRCDVLGE